MILSMTGYGRSEKQLTSAVCSVEIRVLNNRFLDLSLKIPDGLSSLEDEIKRLLAETLQRGAVQLIISLNGLQKDSLAYLNNLSGLQEVWQRLQTLASHLGLPAELSLRDLLAVPELRALPAANASLEPFFPLLRDALREALDQVIAMRRQEGSFLVREIESLLTQVADQTAQIEQLATQTKDQVYASMRLKLSELCNSLAPDDSRLLQEAALLTKRLDVTEECARMRSHVAQCRAFLAAGSPLGKKLNFLLQEMNREISTIGSKSENAAIAYRVVQVKDDLEKIREQIQNLL